MEEMLNVFENWSKIWSKYSIKYSYKSWNLSILNLFPGIDIFFENGEIGIRLKLSQQ